MMNPMVGHSEPHCFRINKNEGGLVGIWTKDLSTTDEPWVGHEGSKKFPFVLVKPNCYPNPEEYETLVPDAVPKEISAKDIEEMRAGLRVCTPRMTTIDPTATNLQYCTEAIDRLEAAQPIPFHWLNHGQFRKERPPLSDAEEEPADEELPLAPRRSFLSNKRRRRDDDDGEDEEADEKDEDGEVRVRLPDENNMLVIKASDDDEDGQRFWLAQLQRVLSKEEDDTPQQVEILWYKGTKEFGKYTYLLVAGKKKKKYVDEIEFSSVFYSFEGLTKAGHIPAAHAKRILEYVEADDF
jgi:hypothetical protein